MLLRCVPRRFWSRDGCKGKDSGVEEGSVLEWQKEVNGSEDEQHECNDEYARVLVAMPAG